MLSLLASLRSPLTSPLPTPGISLLHSPHGPLFSHPLYGFPASSPAPAVPLPPQIAVRGKSPNTFSQPCSPVPLVPTPPPRSTCPPPPVTRLASSPINPRLAVLTSSCSSGDGVGMRERARTRGSRAKKKPLPVPHLSRPGWGAAQVCSMD